MSVITKITILNRAKKYISYHGDNHDTYNPHERSYFLDIVKYCDMLVATSFKTGTIITIEKKRFMMSYKAFTCDFIKCCWRYIFDDTIFGTRGNLLYLKTCDNSYDIYIAKQYYYSPGYLSDYKIVLEDIIMMLLTGKITICDLTFSESSKINE